MATVQRPFFPPWKRGEAYNRPTLDEDLLRLRKYYFDRGFLAAQARVKTVTEEAETNAVHIEIDIVEGLATHVTQVNLVNMPPELPSQETLREALPLRADQRISKADFEQTKAQLIRLMHDAGYARATVIPQTEVDPQARTAIASRVGNN